jgi:peptidoglycan/LPS O-acetylase OafA/YrhL
MVVIVHFGFLPGDWRTQYQGSLVDEVITAVWVLFNGPAAVIVFFLVSGFCIHFPSNSSESLDVVGYYARRMTRIGIPGIIAAAAYAHLRERPDDWNQTIFWTVICEAIFYLAYPVLVALRRRTSWELLIAATLSIALVLALSNPDALRAAHNDYIALGKWTWVIGLPCWIMGCWLAENYTRFPTLSSGGIWRVRAVVFALSVGLRVLKFTSSSVLASNTVSLNLFAPVLCAWLGLEIRYYLQAKPVRLTEWMGTWSYSLYLAHPLVFPLLAASGMTGLAIPGGLQLLITYLLTPFIAYALYLGVEWPSHRFAKLLGTRAAKQGRWKLRFLPASRGS